MKIFETHQNDFLISTDSSKLDLHLIHDYLSTKSYWAKNIPFEIVQRSVEHSFCFGLYQHSNNGMAERRQIGFARLVTDHATFAYLADVFVLEEFRGRGLSKWLMDFIMSNTELQGLRRWMLATRDAHSLYAQFGFMPCDHPERLMQIVRPGIYEVS